MKNLKQFLNENLQDVTNVYESEPKSDYDKIVAMISSDDKKNLIKLLKTHGLNKIKALQVYTDVKNRGFSVKDALNKTLLTESELNDIQNIVDTGDIDTAADMLAKEYEISKSAAIQLVTLAVDGKTSLKTALANEIQLNESYNNEKIAKLVINNDKENLQCLMSEYGFSHKHISDMYNRIKLGSTVNEALYSVFTAFEDSEPIAGRFYICTKDVMSQVLNAPGKTFTVKKGWHILVKSVVPSNTRVRFTLFKPNLDVDIQDAIKDVEETYSGLYVTTKQFKDAFTFDNIMNFDTKLRTLVENA